MEEGLSSRRLLPPNHHARVLIDAKGAIEFWIVQNVPQSIYRGAGRQCSIGQNSVCRSKDEAQGGVVAFLDCLLNGGCADRCAQRCNGPVVCKVLGWRQIGPEKVLSFTQGFLNYAIVLHGREQITEIRCGLL